ncbi:hypothetical protein [Pseudohongiella spirulinae]|uniref:Uncharacterized protein n=1 Tax=Pseudohongiella spirulinae TaxID=1249552 RepID=A0A0S2K9R8_9GAMM|nr:hypothetical protein [Pseudohongiella spirulinae]ALO44901.1 hypothetical protein PS2015_207 [Pseudohongiella spirulinae]
MKLNFNSWMQDADRCINSAIAECFNSGQIGGWQENHITTEILKGLVGIGVEFEWEQYAQRIKWEAYKLAGNLEHSNGDIGLLVNVRLSGETFVKGVAFYEAKKQYFDPAGKAIGFKSINVDQLSRIRDATHASSVLFYDVDISESRACATSVQAVFVHELAKGDLLKFSCRLVTHYGCFWVYSLGQNFRGFGLDHSEEAVKALEEYAASKYAPSVLLNVGVGMTSILEPVLDGFCASLDNYEQVLAKQTESPDPEEPGHLDDSYDR